MKCELVRNRLSEFIDDALSNEIKTIIEAHLKECEACRQELDALRQVSATLKGLDRVNAPGDFLKKFHRRIDKRKSVDEFLRDLFAKPHVGIPVGIISVIIVALFIAKLIDLPLPFTSNKQPVQLAKVKKQTVLPEEKEIVGAPETVSRVVNGFVEYKDDIRGKEFDEELVVHEAGMKQEVSSRPRLQDQDLKGAEDKRMASLSESTVGGEAGGIFLPDNTVIMNTSRARRALGEVQKLLTRMEIENAQQPGDLSGYILTVYLSTDKLGRLLNELNKLASAGVVSVDIPQESQEGSIILYLHINQAP